MSESKLIDVGNGHRVGAANTQGRRTLSNAAGATVGYLFDVEDDALAAHPLVQKALADTPAARQESAEKDAAEAAAAEEAERLENLRSRSQKGPGKNKDDANPDVAPETA